MNAAPKFADYAPTIEAATIVELPLDKFRKHVGTEGFPAAMKCGYYNLFSRAELVRWKRERDRARKNGKN